MPQLNVESASDAVEFYKAAFGAVEVSRAVNPKRKADQELPRVVSAELKLGSSSFLVSDVDDSAALVKSEGTRFITYSLETADVAKAVEKAVAAGAIADGEIAESEDGLVAKLNDPYGFAWKISTPAPKKVAERERMGNNVWPMFEDLGGISDILEDLKFLIFQLYNPESCKKSGFEPTRAILLKGPRGCGKTMLAKAIGNESSGAGFRFHNTKASELLYEGSPLENIKELFAEAYRTAPSIIFIDDIDLIGSKRENLQSVGDRMILSMLNSCMEGSHKPVQTSDYVLVIGATNRPDDLDASLRRPGRFDREITLRAPDERARLEILSVLLTNSRVEGSLDLAKIARSTHAFVGADLKALVNEAGRLAIKRITDRRKSDLAALVNKAGNLANIDGRMSDCCEDWCKPPLSTEETETISIMMADLEEAAKVVQTSSTREGFSSIPNVKWEDVGGLTELKEEFKRLIIRPLREPETYAETDLGNGFLLCGPPGCGKTLIAKAVANEAGVNFIHVQGAELLTNYVGEHELAVRELLSKARTCSPCVIFFDEVDALIAKCDGAGGGLVKRLLRQLMIELMDLDEKRNVFIGATNRLDDIDSAFLRNGRFGRIRKVALPNAQERGSILKALARNMKIDASVNLIAFGREESCENLSGSDLFNLLKEAGMFAAREGRAACANAREGAGKGLSGPEISELDADVDTSGIKKQHLELALEKIREQKQRYHSP